MSEINYYEVTYAFYDAQNMPTNGKRYFSEGHIFDEEKSVKWNKEEVERQNDLIRKQNQAAREARANARIKAENLAVDYLHQEWPSISRPKIINLFQYIYDKHFDDNYQIERVIDICEELLEIFTREDEK